GEGFAFLPMGALIVDFVLTISISVSAGASAVISYAPSLAHLRLPLALVLLVTVAGLMWFGHLGRAVFAVLTLVFLGVAIVVLLLTARAQPQLHAAVVAPHSPPIAVMLAFPVAMALSTGVEAPSSAIAQLAQLDSDDRRRFGRWALWLTLGIVGALTLALTATAVRLGVGLPPAESTLISEVARRGGAAGVFTAFQATTALLLLSAASSSFQAGPGLLKALSRQRRSDGSTVGVLPAPLGRANRHHVPVLGVGVFLVLSAVVVAAAGARDQELVLFYAVSVFVSFLVGLVAMATIARREARRGWFALNVAAAVVVAFTLVVNLTRPAAIGSLTATALVAGGLALAWVRAGRPRGIAHAVADAEVLVGEELDGDVPGSA
ncbi:MAG: APC family permease, partial [Cellulomonas sp.]